MIPAPTNIKSKTALLEWILNHADGLAADLRRGRTAKLGRNVDADLRASMTSLLECAEFVLAVSDAGVATVPPSPGRRPEYAVLDIGQLRTRGYLGGAAESGLLSVWREGVLLPFAVRRLRGSEDFTLQIGPPNDVQRINITATHPSFGGVRHWLVCPGLDAKCGRRFLRLYRATAGGGFACRECHKASHDAGWRTARDRKVHSPVIQQAA